MIAFWTEDLFSHVVASENFAWSITFPQRGGKKKKRKGCPPSLGVKTTGGRV